MKVSDFKKKSKKELAKFVYYDSPLYKESLLNDYHKQRSVRVHTKLFFFFLAVDFAEDIDDYHVDAYKLKCIKRSKSKQTKTEFNTVN